MTLTADKKNEAPVRVTLSDDQRDRGIPMMMELPYVKEMPPVSEPVLKTSIQRIAMEIVDVEGRKNNSRFSIYLKGVAGDDVKAQAIVVATLLPLCLERIEGLKRRSESNLAALTAQQLGGIPDKLPSPSVFH